MATDITSQSDFDILVEVLESTRLGSEGLALREGMFEACEKYARWVRYTYYQKRKAVYNQQFQKELCLVCKVNKRLPTHDVCVNCRKEHWPEEQKLKIHLYRAKKACTPATLTLGQWISTLKRYDFRCAYCPRGNYEVLEHYVPISSGGGTTQENCIPACRSCNSRKHSDNPDRIN